MTTNRHNSRATARGLLSIGVILGAALATGCGGEQPTAVITEGEERQISDVVEEFNEYRGDPRKAPTLFAATAAPKKDALKKYARYSYWPSLGRPTIRDDTATMNIALRDETTGEDAGQVEWTFKKEAQGWKIADAPLP